MLATESAYDLVSVMLFDTSWLIDSAVADIALCISVVVLYSFNLFSVVSFALEMASCFAWLAVSSAYSFNTFCVLVISAEKPFAVASSLVSASVFV